jgi:hypothetical protein
MKKRSKKIAVIESDGTKSVLVNDQIFMSWASWDTASQRMVIVQLIGECGLFILSI